MIKNLPLNVVTEEKNIPSKRTWEDMIEERILLKIKIKLLHIYYFDKDLQTLQKNHLDIKDLSLKDFQLTEGYQLFVPVKDRIVEFPNNYDTKLRSYLIYLSYLYNINFLEIYYKEPNKLYKLIFSIHITEEIKQNLFNLLNNKEAPYFNEMIEDLNNAEYRENLQKESITLKKKLHLSVK